jgi:hypothetical protein
MTLWELAACVDGYNQAQGGEPPLEAPTPEEFQALIDNAARIAGNDTRH